jgi:hypothetical protein
MSFVRIHPFFDGNGRVARLVANLPILRCGHPPIVISRQRRGEYIDLLWKYENAVGKIQRSLPLVPKHPALERFATLLNDEWRHTVALVETARKRAAERAGGFPAV